MISSRYSEAELFDYILLIIMKGTRVARRRAGGTYLTYGDRL